MENYGDFFHTHELKSEKMLFQKIHEGEKFSHGEKLVNLLKFVKQIWKKMHDFFISRGIEWVDSGSKNQNSPKMT